MVNPLLLMLQGASPYAMLGQQQYQPRIGFQPPPQYNMPPAQFQQAQMQAPAPMMQGFDVTAQRRPPQTMQAPMQQPMQASNNIPMVGGATNPSLFADIGRQHLAMQGVSPAPQQQQPAQPQAQQPQQAYSQATPLPIEAKRPSTEQDAQGDGDFLGGLLEGENGDRMQLYARMMELGRDSWDTRRPGIGDAMAEFQQARSQRSRQQVQDKREASEWSRQQDELQRIEQVRQTLPEEFRNLPAADIARMAASNYEAPWQREQRLTENRQRERQIEAQFAAAGRGAIDDQRQGNRFAATLRNEFMRRNDDFVSSRDMYQNLRALAAESERNPAVAGANDIAMVYAFMKALDPTSAVRETEFATAENAGGVDAHIRTQWNKLLRGERLTPEVRNSYISAARTRYVTGAQQFARDLELQRQMGSQMGLDASFVAPELRLTREQWDNAPGAAQRRAAPAPAPGGEPTLAELLAEQERRRRARGPSIGDRLHNLFIAPER